MKTAHDLRRFVDLPYRLYANESRWVAPLRFDVRRRLSPRHNPFFDHGVADFFLAERGGAAVGRIAAISNRRHNETHGDGVGFFGFFECADDPAAAAELVGTAADWVRGRGHAALRGPTSFSTNDECGLLVDGFDTPPTVLTPWTPPHYPRLLEGAGLAGTKDLLGYECGGSRGELRLPERLARTIERLRVRHGVQLRALDRRNFARDVERIQDAYNGAWERNWGFVPLTDREIRHMASELRPVHLPGLVPFAERDGEVIGFGLALPDLNVPLRANRSGRLLPGLVRVFWALKRRRIARTRVLLLGVRPDHRGKGVDAMLCHFMFEHALSRGISWTEASWILEDNRPMCNALERMGFTAYKRWRLYERAV